MLKKILVLILSLSVICCALTSCSETAADVIAKADKALLSKPYQVDMDMSFSCDNQELSSIFESMETDAKMYIDGDSMKLVMEMMGAELEMLCHDKVMYMAVSFGGQSQKAKATMNDEQLEEFMGENSTTSDFSVSDFETVEMKTEKGKTIITCTGISEEALAKEVNSAMEDMGLNGTGAELAIENLKLVTVIEDGKYDSYTITGDYVIKIQGLSFNVGYEIELEFDYENVALSKPADASSYQTLTYDELMNGLN